MLIEDHIYILDIYVYIRHCVILQTYAISLGERIGGWGEGRGALTYCYTYCKILMR